MMEAKTDITYFQPQQAALALETLSNDVTHLKFAKLLRELTLVNILQEDEETEEDTLSMGVL